MDNHSFSSMFYHLVWTTKNREPYIQKEFKEKLYKYIGMIILRKDWHLLAVGGVQDHIHILLQKNIKTHVSQVVSCIKSNSSKFIKENFNEEFAWQNGYGVFTVDVTSIKRLKKYILNQEKHHISMETEKEFCLLQERCDIKLD